MKKIYCAVCFLIILFGCSDPVTFQKPPDAVTVVTPTTLTTKIEANDSSYLKINLHKDGYAISLLKKSIATGKLGEVDNFLVVNKDLIDTNKILVIQPASGEKKAFMQLIPLLQKHGIFKFKIVTD